MVYIIIIHSIRLRLCPIRGLSMQTHTSERTTVCTGSITANHQQQQCESGAVRRADDVRLCVIVMAIVFKPIAEQPHVHAPECGIMVMPARVPLVGPWEPDCVLKWQLRRWSDAPHEMVQTISGRCDCVRWSSRCCATEQIIAFVSHSPTSPSPSPG